jgi:hypothetical protein
MSRLPNCKLIGRYIGHAKAHGGYRVESGLYIFNDHDAPVMIAGDHAPVTGQAPRLE